MKYNLVTPLPPGHIIKGLAIPQASVSALHFAPTFCHSQHYEQFPDPTLQPKPLPFPPH